MQRGVLHSKFRLEYSIKRRKTFFLIQEFKKEIQRYKKVISLYISVFLKMKIISNGPVFSYNALSNSDTLFCFVFGYPRIRFVEKN